jgi:hypothetical protein
MFSGQGVIHQPFFLSFFNCAPINTSFKQCRSALPHKNSCGVYKTPTTVQPIISLHLSDIDLLLPKPKSCADVGILLGDVQRNCELKRSLIKYTK